MVLQMFNYVVNESNTRIYTCAISNRLVSQLLLPIVFRKEHLK